jgi:hypothetical protein
LPRQRTDGSGPAAGQQPNDVDLMRALAQDHAAAQRGVELLGPAQAIQKVGVILRGDHPDGADGTALDDLARAEYRTIEAVAVPDDEPRARALNGVDHRAGFRQRYRHRLLDQRVLAGSCRGFDVRRMVLVRRGHVDDVDGRVGADRFDASVDASVEIGGEACRRVGARVARRNEADARVGHERRQASA